MINNCTKLASQVEVEFACKAVSTWMKICNENNKGTSYIDVDHSALLRRILSGGSIHKFPPPKSYSYPDWSLVEKEEIEISGFHEYRLDENIVVVNQSPEYEWVDKEKNIIKHTRLGIEYQYFEKEVEYKNNKYVGKFLKRLTDYNENY